MSNANMIVANAVILAAFAAMATLAGIGVWDAVKTEIARRDTLAE